MKLVSAHFTTVYRLVIVVNHKEMNQIAMAMMNESIFDVLVMKVLIKTEQDCVATPS